MELDAINILKMIGSVVPSEGYVGRDLPEGLPESEKLIVTAQNYTIMGKGGGL